MRHDTSQREEDGCLVNILKKLLTEKGVTQYRMAKDLGLASSVVSEWCAGKYRPKADKLLMLAKYFDVSIDALIEGLKNE